MSINHMTITKVPCSSDRIYDAADLLNHFASDLEKNTNAIFYHFCKVISGQDFLETYYFYQCLSLWMMLKSLSNEWTTLTISPKYKKYKTLTGS